MKITKKELESLIRQELIEAHARRFNFSRDPYGDDWIGPAGMFGGGWIDPEDLEEPAGEDSDDNGYDF
jgi:hypothetical protein